MISGDSCRPEYLSEPSPDINEGIDVNALWKGQVIMSRDAQIFAVDKRVYDNGLKNFAILILIIAAIYSASCLF